MWVKKFKHGEQQEQAPQAMTNFCLDSDTAFK